MIKSLKNLKVSVIIPTYNRADLLNRVIKSVLNQTFKDFELIIVDDGSTDNTKEVVKRFQEKDKRVKYIWQKNSGAPASPKNTGIRNSKGQFLAFLDSDDRWLSEKLEKQITLFEKSKNLGIVSCNCWRFYTKQNDRKEIDNIKRHKVPQKYFSDILERCFISSSSSVVIPKFVFYKVGLYDEQFKTSDDRDLYIRILKDYDFDFVEEPLFHYYIHNENLSGCGLYNSRSYYLRAIREDIIIFNKYKKDYDNNLSSKWKILRKIANYHSRIDDKVNTKKYLWKALKCDPFYLKNYTSLIIISFFGIKVYKSIGRIKRYFKIF